MVWFDFWCLTPLSTIFQLYRGGNRSPEEYHQPVASHWQTFSQYVISSTPHHFNKISIISWRKPESRRIPPTCRKSLTNFFTICCIEYTSPWTGFELMTLVVIDTDYTDSCKSDYHTITTMMAPCFFFIDQWLTQNTYGRHTAKSNFLLIFIILKTHCLWNPSVCNYCRDIDSLCHNTSIKV